MFLKIGIFVLAYILGSIPTAAWYAKYFHNIDITKHGSGNSGATNSMRVLGKKAGIIVLLIDVLKGFLPVFFFNFYFSESYQAFMLGIVVILGHIFSVFLSFKGGKGIATSLGVILAVFPIGALISLAIFIGVVWISKYVSLGSLSAALSFALILSFQYPKDTALLFTGWILFFLLTYTHRTNIKNLIAGSENKFSGNKK